MSLPIGSITVATPGTAVAVATSGNAITAVSFRARTNNTGAVYVGDSGVSSSNGYRLEPGDSLFFDADAPHGPEELVSLPARFLSVIVSSEDRN